MYILIQDRRKTWEGGGGGGFSVLLGVKSVGSDKQVPIVIGKSPKPRCF
jgi:hypothetical protein